jgi:ABC-2 type transport system permease protein
MDKTKPQPAIYLESVKRIFRMFFAVGLKARRAKVFYLISLIPILLAALIKLSLFLSARDITGIYIFSNIIMAFYLQFLILILALFFGTSICSEELEGKTLTYLTTRPIPKSAVLLGKFGASYLMTVMMTGLGIVIAFLILNVDTLGDLSIYGVLFRDLAVLSLGLLCYMAFFTMIGTFLKKSIMFGLIFSFGWENVIQYFPGSTQKFAIAHYLKSLLPTPTTERFSFLLFRLEPTSPAAAVAILLFLTALFLALACLIFSSKEYILQD